MSISPCSKIKRKYYKIGFAALSSPCIVSTDIFSPTLMQYSLPRVVAKGNKFPASRTRPKADSKVIKDKISPKFFAMR